MRIWSRCNTQWERQVRCVTLYTKRKGIFRITYAGSKAWALGVSSFVPNIPSFIWDQPWAFHLPLSLAAQSKGGFQTEHPADTSPVMDLCLWCFTSSPQDYPSLCLLSLSWSIQGRASGSRWLIRLPLPETETESQPAAWRLLELCHLLGSRRDATVSGGWVFCVDACFLEAWQLNTSFDSLNDANICLFSPGFCLYDQGCWLLLANQRSLSNMV